MLDDILRSLEGAKRAEPGPQVYDKILFRIASTERFSVIARPYLAMAAACLLLLVSANIYALNQQHTFPSSPSIYQVEGANFDLY